MEFCGIVGFNLYTISINTKKIGSFRPTYRNS